MRAATGQKLGLRTAILWVCVATAYAVALSMYKSALLQQIAYQNFDGIKAKHQKVLSLFQASFYFFYDDQFIPGIRQALEKPVSQNGTKIERIEVLSNTGSLLFDSNSGAGPQSPRNFNEPEIISRINNPDPSIFIHGFRIEILIPSGNGAQYAMLYTISATSVRTRILFIFLGGLVLAASLFWSWRLRLVSRLAPHARELERRFLGLRVKFLVTIVVINLLTAATLFFTLSALQTREQTERIEKESILFSQFSTAELVSNFTNFFYFYYSERFLPGIKKVIASDENLLGIRIISYRNDGVLFDSEQAPSVPTSLQLADLPKVEYPEEVKRELKSRDFAVRHLVRNGEKLLSVINTYRNENQEALFLVEYLYSYHSLVRSIKAIREQVLLDLVPALLLGLLIAAVFARLLIGPIRRLVRAVQRVTAGDYDVSVDLKKMDEIGELVTAFNTMTGELKKKKELRKYLSDSTYRQIMEAPDSPEGLRLGGSRVPATILFSDIRNFVAHCESLEAEEVTAMLNEYFSTMVEVVYKYGGEVDKFIGDALLAVFYASDESRVVRPADTVRSLSPEATSIQAIYCALEMREKLSEFNAKRANVKKNTIEIGIGISYGEIISGPIGSKDRMDFTVIGDVVNLANRIEKLSKLGKHTKIVFSNHVEEKVRGLLEYEEIRTEGIRGKEESVRVYELVGLRDFKTLVGHLSGTNTELKKRSIELLGLSRNQEALPYVLRMIDDLEDGVRLQVVLSLIKLSARDDEAVLNVLFKRIKTEHARNVISAIISAVGKLCTTERIVEIAPFLESKDERIVANAIEAMAQVRSPRCTDLILPKLGSLNNRIKANAAMALFAAGHLEVIGALKPMLMHSDSRMKSSAAFALGELTYLAEHESLMSLWDKKFEKAKPFLAELQECVPMLVALLKDPDPMVKRQAVIALGKIKDKSAVLPIIDTIESEKDSKELIREISHALKEIGSHKLVREVISRFS